MKKFFTSFIPLFCLLFFLTGCHPIGGKETSMSIIYFTASILSFLLLIGYIALIKKKEPWFYVLFTAVFIVNTGYLLLSVSDTLTSALNANKITYLGSAFLPLSMFMIIMKATKLKYKKWTPYLLAALSFIIFLLAASPGYLDIYYKSVTLEKVYGVTVLNKEYGPLHCVYLFYLLGYFSAMISVIIHAVVNKKIDSVAHGVILLVAVFVNICVWLLEQLVKINFEFLSVSYIISELFLISVYLMIEHQEALISSLQEKINTAAEQDKKQISPSSPEFAEKCKYFKEQLPRLTPTERAVYNLYLEGKTTKEVLQELNILENTLKFHNKNIYGKLGVSSRKQLLQYAKAIEKGM